MSKDHIAQLERLNRLREAGALSESEFEDQKQAILAGGSRTGSTRMALFIGAGIVAAILAVILTLFLMRGSDADRGSNPASPSLESSRAPTSEVAKPLDPETPEAVPADTPKNRLTFATSDEVIGINPAYLEQRLGVPKEKSASYLVFDVGGCTISYWATGSRIAGFTTDVDQSCKPTIQGKLIGPNTTLGEILSRENWGVFTAGCLYACGNAADPVIDLTYRGSRATGFISIQYSTSYDQASEALSLWEQAVRREQGLGEYDSPADYDVFNCVSDPPANVRKLIARMSVRSITVTEDDAGPC